MPTLSAKRWYKHSTVRRFNTLENGNHVGLLYKEGGNSLAVFHNRYYIAIIIHSDLFGYIQFVSCCTHIRISLV